MCRPMGVILEVRIRLPVGYAGEFVHVRAKIDVNKWLTRFVLISKEGKKFWYQVQYEKLPAFVAIVVSSANGIRSVVRASMTSPRKIRVISCWQPWRPWCAVRLFLVWSRMRQYSTSWKKHHGGTW